MALSSWTVSPTRIRSYLTRIPLATRLLLSAVFAVSVLSLRFSSLQDWGCLLPAETNLATLNRLSTYPFFHLNILHLLFNLLALTPLIERFEAEQGTIVTLALFTGPFSLLPGALYTILSLVTHIHTHIPVCGSSIWVFLLASSSAYRTYLVQPSITIITYSFPTYATPLVGAVLLWILVPGTSLLGHLCGCAVGYGWGSGVLKFLAPPERPLRWIEGKLNLLGRLPHYVSVDQKVFGRYGVLPSVGTMEEGGGEEMRTPRGFRGTGAAGQRLGP